jgi:hypothetical protein
MSLLARSMVGRPKFYHADSRRFRAGRWKLMNVPPMYSLRRNLKKLTPKTHCHDRHGQTRRTSPPLEDRLSQLPEDSRREKNALLDALLTVEIYTNGDRNALAAIDRLRAVGFRTFAERFNNTVLAAHLSTRTAYSRTRDPKKQYGLWNAYVDSDERCAREMDGVLQGTSCHDGRRSWNPEAQVRPARRCACFGSPGECLVPGLIERVPDAAAADMADVSTSREAATPARDIRELASKEKVGFCASNRIKC